MIQRLLRQLDASPVNFLATEYIANELTRNGFRHIDASQPIGNVSAGDKFYVTKND